MAYKGEIRLLACTAHFVPPAGWALCDGSTPERPDLRGRLPVHADVDLPLGEPGGAEQVRLEAPDLPRHRHAIACGGAGTDTTPVAALWGTVGGDVSAPYTTEPQPAEMMAAACMSGTGGGETHDNVMPFMALNYVYALGMGVTDDEPFLGEVRAFAGRLPTYGWAPCDGSLLTIRTNVALYSVLQTTFGGDGHIRFGLPNLQGLSVLGAGNGPGLSPRPFAGTGGAVEVALSESQMPLHSHRSMCTSASANALSPEGNAWATDPGGLVLFADVANDQVYAGAVASTGEGNPHENRQPFLGLTYGICTAGVFPAPSSEEATR
jgi:microcystin-dependent protein